MKNLTIVSYFFGLKIKSLAAKNTAKIIGTLVQSKKRRPIEPVFMENPSKIR